MKALVLGVVAVMAVWNYFEILAARYAHGKPKYVHLFAGAMAAFLSLVVFATGTAIAGVYSFWLVLGLVLGTALAVRVFFALRYKVPIVSIKGVLALLRGTHFSVLNLAAAGVLLGAFALYSLFPAHYLWGSRDYGLYEINGIHISQTGGVEYDTDVFLSENYEDVAGFINPQYSALFSSYLLGESDDAGEINPQFMPMFPALLAVGYDAGGYSGLLRVNAIVTVLSLLCFYYFAKQFFGGKTAFVALLLLAVCPAEFWGARITQSEQLAQLLFLLTAYVMAMAWQKNKTNWLLLGAALIGVACFSRIDNYLVLIGLYAATCYVALWHPGRLKGFVWASAVQTGLAALSVWYGFSYHNYYFVEHWVDKFALKALVLLCLAALAATIAVCVLRLLLKKRSIPNPVAIVCENQPALVELFLFVAAAFAVAYFVRPLLGIEFADNSLREYSWYMSAVALPLAIAGLYHLARGYNGGKGVKALEPHLFLLVCALASIVGYTIDPNISPDHFWASRRWVPINFPFIFLFAAYAVVALWGWAKQVDWASKKFARPALRVLAVVLVAGMAGYMALQSRVFAFSRVYAGLDGQYAQLVEEIPEDALVLASHNRMASVLKYVYGENVYLLNPDSESFGLSTGINGLARQRLDVVSLQAYLEEHEELYLLGSVNSLWQHVGLEEIRTAIMGGKFPEDSIGSYPSQMIDSYANASLYRVTPLEGNPSFDFIHEMSLPYGSEYTEDGSIEGAGSLLFYGPYLALEAGTYKVSVTIDAGSDMRLAVTASSGANLLNELEIDGPGTYSVEFPLSSRVTEIEFALYSNSGERTECSAIVLEQLSSAGSYDLLELAQQGDGAAMMEAENLVLRAGEYSLAYALEGDEVDVDIQVTALEGEEIIASANVGQSGAGSFDFSLWQDAQGVGVRVVDNAGNAPGVSALHMVQTNYVQTINLWHRSLVEAGTYRARNATVFGGDEWLMRDIYLSLRAGSYEISGVLEMVSSENPALLKVEDENGIIAELEITEAGRFTLEFEMLQRTLNVKISLAAENAEADIFCSEFWLYGQQFLEENAA